MTAGATQGAVSKLLAGKKKERLSVSVPSTSSNALGHGAALGVYAKLRYQLLCGADRALTSYFDVIGVSMFFSAALRILNVRVGETSRLAWLGNEADPLVNSDNVLKAYNRPSDSISNDSSSWFISKNAIVAGLGLLGIRQPSGDSAPKARRKRVAISDFYP